MKTEDLKINQTIWLLYNNRVAELLVSKIVTTQELREIDAKGGNTELTKTVAFASLSTRLQHELTLVDNTFFDSREALIESLR